MSTFLRWQSHSVEDINRALRNSLERARPNRTVVVILLILAGFYAIAGLVYVAASQELPMDLATVSAASSKPIIAPGSLATSYGQRLASGRQVAPLPYPTVLLGTTVSIRDKSGVERSARIIFVSAGQVNFLAPEELMPGPATVTIRSGDGNVSTGTVEVSAVAPGIFTVSQDGMGLPMGEIIRSDNRSTLPYAIVGDRVEPRAVNLGSSNETTFLVLYLTGVGNAPNTDGNPVNGAAENVQVIIGGQNSTVQFSGKHSQFVGLDQINAVIPRSLLDSKEPGNKQVDVVVKYPGAPDSNRAQLLIASPDGIAPLQVTDFNGPSPALANTEIQIVGSGLSPVAENNRVSFGTDTLDVKPGEIKEAGASRITVTVPFGAVSGNISLNSDQKLWTSDRPLTVRTSLSALVKDTDNNPIPHFVDAKVCAFPCAVNSPSTTIQPGGWFVLPDAPVGMLQTFAITQSPTQAANTFRIPNTPIRSQILTARDNHLTKDIFIQQIYGPSGFVGNGTAVAAKSASPDAVEGLSLTIEGFTFTTFEGTNAVFPGGARRGEISLTPIKNSLTPAPLPPMVFSSAIAQLTPFGVKLSPGGKFVFPNRDRLIEAPNLYKFDLSDATFKDTGIQCRFTGDGSFIETPAGAIDETSIYFVAVRKPTTTITGRVLDADGKTPVRGVTVTARGQQTSTDGNGSFSLENVPTGTFMANAPASTNRFTNAITRRATDEDIQVSASYLRPSGRTDTAGALVSNANENSTTTLTTPLLLTSSNSNRPPSLVVDQYQTLPAGDRQNYSVQVFDLDAGQTIARVEVSGASFAEITGSGNSYVLTLSPNGSNVGTHKLTITASDSAGGSTEAEVTVVITPSPNPSPIIGELDPKMVIRFRPQLELAINGNNFVQGAKAMLDGNPLFTVFVSENSLRAIIVADELRVAKKRVITVVNPQPGGGVSNEAELIVANPVPTLTTLNPSQAIRGSGPLTLTVDGTNFVPDSQVRWNGSPRPTTFVSSNRLTAQIPASDLTTEGSAAVTVFNPLLGGGVTSALTFQIVFPVPGVSSISPSVINVDDETGVDGLPTELTATLQITGSGFVPETQIRIGPASAPVFFGTGTFINQNSISLTLPDAVNPPAGAYSVLAVNPSPGGGQSVSSGMVRFIKFPVIESGSFQYCVSGGTVRVTGAIMGYGWESDYDFSGNAYKLGDETSITTVDTVAFQTPTTFSGQIEFPLAAISPGNQVLVEFTVFPPPSQTGTIGFVIFPTLTINPAQSCATPLLGSASGGNTPGVRIRAIRSNNVGRRISRPYSSSDTSSERASSNSTSPPQLNRRSVRRPE